MLIRKLRLDRGWSQETLADLSGLSVRTIQRLERGGNASLDSLGALAAIFEVDITTLSSETHMSKANDISEQEREALEYVRDIKGFYSHLMAYLIAVPVFIIADFFDNTDITWYIWPIMGWGIGVAAHGISVFEFFSPFNANWEKRQVEKRLRRAPR